MTKKEKNEKNLQLLVSKLDSDVEFYDQFIEDWIQFRLDSYKELRAKYNLRKIDIVYLKNKYNITIPQEVVTAKTKQTRLERYGDENYNNTEKFKHTRHSKTKEEELEITNKRRKTCLEKYGVSSVQLIPGVQDKKKETFLEKYGVEHPMKSDVCKNKSIQTCMEKYGVEYALQSDEVKEKGRKTKLEKYGDENYNNQEKQKILL